MGPNRRKLAFYAAAIAAIGLPALPASAEEAIVFAATLPLTGPFAAVAKDQLEGMRDYIGYLNGNGGVRGRQVKLLVEDTQYKVDQAVAAFKKFMASDKPIAVFGDGTGFVRAVAPENNERYKVLMTSTSYASDLIDLQKYGYHFMSGPTYSEATAMLLQYIKDTHKGGKPKLAVVHSASEYGRDPLDSIRKRAAELGIDIVLVTEMKFRDVDVTGEAIKLRQAKPDYTLIHGFGGAPIFTELMKLAREYKVETRFMGTFWEGSRAILKRAGDAADGFIAVSNYAWNTADATGETMKAIDGIRRKRDAAYDGYPDIYYMQGWASMMLFVKAADATVAANQPLTGENLRNALQGTVNWDTGGVIGVPVSLASHSIPVAQVVRFDAKSDMKPVPVTSWIDVN